MLAGGDRLLGADVRPVEAEEVVAVGRLADDIAELEGLRDRGLLTEEEFKRAKEKALA
jgi:hypothetical protein